MSLLHINDESFAETIKTGVVLVDFWATWCGPCQMFGPVFEAASVLHPDIKFAKFEIDDTNKRTPATYGIRSIPTVMAFRDGNLVSTRVGLMQPSDLENWLKEI